MGDFKASVLLPRTRLETFNYLRDPRNFLKLFPDSATKHLDARLPEFLDPGACLELNIQAFGSHIQIIQEISEVAHAERIVARQLKGPFRLWIHEQKFQDADNDSTLLTNSIRFEPPGGLLGMFVTQKQIMSHLEEWIAKGHDRLRETLIADVK
jgi:ligand-binding SRPBCC domain-containing protein